ncbi:MAG: hypothetical protein HQL47_08210 [Gammaproteobacteria bacterium]|nr:hypothetical protein [Gammaproteobacteria bacterium]
MLPLQPALPGKVPGKATPNHHAIDGLTMHQRPHYLATAYHESGHAIVTLLRGYPVVSINILDAWSGYVTGVNHANIVQHWLSRSETNGRIAAQLGAAWRDAYLIYHAGEVAERDLAPRRGDDIRNGTMGDMCSKFELSPDEETAPDLIWHFYTSNFRETDGRHYEDCRRFLKQPQVSRQVRTLAEILLRSPRLSGPEAINLLLTNSALASGQADLFWQPQDDSVWEERRRRAAYRPPRQLALF